MPTSPNSQKSKTWRHAPRARSCTLSGTLSQLGLLDQGNPLAALANSIQDNGRLLFQGPRRAFYQPANVQPQTYYLCPQEPPALANCACSKNQNSDFVSQIINTSANYHCSGRAADISSAQAFFAAYCAMDAGTTKFPEPSKPPGDSQ
jgi:hypothetical protein